RLPVRDALFRIEQVAASDQVLELAHTELRHDLADFLGDEEKEIDHVLRLPRESPAQLRVLRRDADRAGVQMALAHHDAAADDERRRRETEFIGPQHCPDHYIPTGLHLSID